MSPSHTPEATADAPRQGDGGLRRILDALPAGIVLIDGDGRVDDCNAAALELLGGPLRGESWRDAVDRAFVGGCKGAGRLDGLSLVDGRQVTVATAPLGGGPGQLVLINDVTETRAVQALVERQRRLFSIGEMVASLTHQIRTPLASALLYVSQVERADLSVAARRRCATRIRACLDHANRLVRDMLAYAGGGALCAEEFDVDSLIEGLRGLSASLLEDPRCRFEVIDECGGARMHGNRDALLTALQNILDNAIQACAATPSSMGNIRLLIRRAADDAVEITVSDDGPGIPPEIRSRITEPFFTTRSQGTGLGLSVAQAVARAHRGVLWIESEVGVGTTVGLRLPVSSAAQVREATPPFAALAHPEHALVHAFEQRRSVG